jgi:predicted MFS family arabinose efflux permease
LVLASYVAVALYVAPALAAAYITQYRFQINQPNYVIAAEMAGMGLASFPALWWIGRLNWSRLARIMLICIALGNAVSMFAATPLTLGGARFLTGLAQGTVSVICMSSIRVLPNPNRNFGLWLFGQLLVGSLALASLPTLLNLGGPAAFFAVLAALALILIWPAGALLPGVRAAASVAAKSGRDSAITWIGLSGLAAILCFYLAFSSVWPLTGQIAHALGFAPERANYALSFAPIGGMLGAALAAGFGSRFGSVLPMAVGMSILAIAAWQIGGNPGFTSYACAAIALMFAWTFVVPYLLGNITAIDRGGQLTAAVNAIIGAGLATGPALSGFLLAHDASYAVAACLSAGLSTVSLLFALPMAQRARFYQR